MGFSDKHMPKLLVHGWWNFGGAKVSKSIGHAVDPLVLLSRYGSGTLRYYFMRDITTGQDANFNEERMIMLHNTELANGLGNLLHRTLSMIHQYLGGYLHPHLGSHFHHDIDTLREENRHSVSEYFLRMRAFEIDRAIAAIMRIVLRSNTFAETCAPWKLSKDRNQKSRLIAVLTALYESVRLAASLLTPILPKESTTILAQLGSEAVHFPNPDPTLYIPLAVNLPEPVFPKFQCINSSKSDEIC